MRPIVLITPTPSQLPRKSFDVLSPLSEGHLVFQSWLGEQYEVLLPWPGGRCITLICSTSTLPPCLVALAPSSPRRPNRPVLWKDQPTLKEPLPNPSPIEEPKNLPRPYCTFPEGPPSNGTKGLAAAAKRHNTSPYRR